MDLTYDALFIAGRWTSPSSDRTVTPVNPSTELPVGRVPQAVESDVDAAVAAARQAFEEQRGWSNWEPSRRADAMERLAEAMDRRAEEFAQRVSAQNGMPITLAREAETGYPTDLLRYFAGLARDGVHEETRTGFYGGAIVVRREPVGVVAAIVPWNFPQALTMFKLAPALAAGCTLVIKPSPETVLDAFLLAEAVIEAGLPPGVVNVISGGRDIGAYLVAHPGIDKVAFTGSTLAGRDIAETCGRLLRPVTLELGGKSAAIILDDIELDLEKIGDALTSATLQNNGQTCFLSTRILAPRSHYDEVVDAFTELASSLIVGDAADSNTQVGPLTTAAQRERVEGYVARGRAEGLRITTGGRRPEAHDRGWFYEPTVFADADNGAVVAREEIFGPVLTVIPYGDVTDAVRMANDSEFGLGGTIWTSDPRRGADVARLVHSGTMGINHFDPDPAAPFGGIKASGLGRELGPEGLHAYQRIQTIYLDERAGSAKDPETHASALGSRM